MECVVSYVKSFLMMAFNFLNYARINVMYKIKSLKKLEKADCDIIKTDCTVYSIYVQVTDINKIAKEISSVIQDTCWINNLLDEDDIDSYLTRAEQTIKYIVEDILNKVENDVSSDFGEYLISNVSQMTLVDRLNHERIPLAELWKEQKSGNPGFDFHSFSPNDFLVYGEAKYNAKNNPYSVAIGQINHFLEIQKDIQEYADLKRIFSKVSSRHKKNSNKAFVASFSLNAKDNEDILRKALECEELQNLMKYPELYIIGVEVCQ